MTPQHPHDPLGAPLLTPEDLAHRFKHHPPRDQTAVIAHEAVRGAAHVFALLLNRHVPDGREKDLAVTAVEEALMWANAGIARDAARGEANDG